MEVTAGRSIGGGVCLRVRATGGASKTSFDGLGSAKPRDANRGKGG